MARQTIVQRCEAAVERFETGASLSLDAMTARKGWRAVAWSRDGKRELVTEIGATRSEAAKNLHAKINALIARRTENDDVDAAMLLLDQELP